MRDARSGREAHVRRLPVSHEPRAGCGCEARTSYGTQPRCANCVRGPDARRKPRLGRACRARTECGTRLRAFNRVEGLATRRKLRTGRYRVAWLRGMSLLRPGHGLLTALSAIAT